MTKQKTMTTTLGFGFIPQESTQHFIVKFLSDEVVIYHNFLYKENYYLTNYEIKAKLPMKKWNQIKDMIQDEFDARMKKNRYKKAKWEEETMVEKMFGKEILLLVWAIESESVNAEMVERAKINWKGLCPEERWYLFTMTNANSGNVWDRKGWRAALKHIFTEN
jgi:hypothetical protein